MEYRLLITGVLLLAASITLYSASPFYDKTYAALALAVMAGLLIVLSVNKLRRSMTYPGLWVFFIGIIVSGILYLDVFESEYIDRYQATVAAMAVFGMLWEGFSEGNKTKEVKSAPRPNQSIVIALIWASSLLVGVYIASRTYYESQRYEIRGAIRYDKYEGTLTPMKVKR